ncbi:MAG: gliding motility-associated C-terminal domain-containing protein [Lewinellaceae bacterium]|nr:gliding motility-associated C-terminal domain-containing protein [Lewinellaceae bacterium]
MNLLCQSDGTYEIYMEYSFQNSWLLNQGPIPADGLPVATGIVSGEPYALLLENPENGCQTLLEGIAECPVLYTLYFPNVIQPSSGVPNGYFTLYTGLEQEVRIDALRIYDRWGELVFARLDFDPNKPELGWNGLIDGNDALPGVYVYVAVLRLPDGEVLIKSGDVTVIR